MLHPTRSVGPAAPDLVDAGLIEGALGIAGGALHVAQRIEPDGGEQRAEARSDRGVATVRSDRRDAVSVGVTTLDGVTRSSGRPGLVCCHQPGLGTRCGDIASRDYAGARHLEARWDTPRR